MAKKDLQRDAFFAHSDQLLLAMCADKDEEVRRKAVKLIRNLRQQVQDEVQEEDDKDFDSDTEVDVDEYLLRYTDDEETDEEEEEEDPAFVLDQTVRKVHVPDHIWQARNYHTMID